MNSIFADNIKVLLDKYGLSHNDLARLSGVNQPTISRLVRGQTAPRGATVEALARALKVDPWVLRTRSLLDKETGELLEPKADTTLPHDFNSMLARLASDATAPAGKKSAVKPLVPAFYIEPDMLLDKKGREQAWLVARGETEKAGGYPALAMTLPTDDLAPVVPRGALLYLAIETDPSHPTLPEDAPVVGVLPLDEGGQTLVFGYPSVSLGRVTLRTARGESVAVDKVVAYVEGWTVFKKRQKSWLPA